MKDLQGENLQLKVIDTEGRLVSEKQLRNSAHVQSSLDLSSVKPGIYYLQISSEQKIYYMMLTKM
jgi:hypothetical protein